MADALASVLALSGGSLAVSGSQTEVLDLGVLRTNVGRLVEASALSGGGVAGWSRYVVRAAALELGILPSSIHELYMARGRGQLPTTFTVPAINLRALSFEAARAVMRAARQLNAGALIFEIARSEIGYTSQRPAEYATNVLAAAIAEGHQGPIFIQGDHFQISAKRYAADPDKELDAVRTLAIEAMHSGFFNIDIDTSTLVDLSKGAIAAQQETNFSLSSQLAADIRAAQPDGVVISIGGEIGEVGGKNSTEAELRAYMGGFNAEFSRKGRGQPGLSKISIQTGTSHGGTVLPDGTIAQVDVDFETLVKLSRVARLEYGLGGAVQHGASTLPEGAFGKFVESEAVEVHLATNFMTMFYEHIPEELRQEMYRWLDENFAGDKKPGMTDEQFYYKTRKNALGEFKAQTYALPADVKSTLAEAWEVQFLKLFTLLGLRDTRRFVDQYVKPVAVQPVLSDYVQPDRAGEEVSDLAD